VIIAIYIHTTNDIIMELLKYGGGRVLEPKEFSLAAMKQRISQMEMKKLYNVDFEDRVDIE
jgi:hypothetical protein